MVHRYKFSKRSERLNVENYKSILKDVKEGLNTCREITCPWINSTAHLSPI